MYPPSQVRAFLRPLFLAIVTALAGRLQHAKPEQLISHQRVGQIKRGTSVRQIEPRSRWASICFQWSNQVDVRKVLVSEQAQETKTKNLRTCTS